jgi:minimal PKS acyl carrier protein
MASNLERKDMRHLTLEMLKQFIHECLGEPSALSEEVQDSSFSELGCDSLVILQLEARLSQEFGVHIPELLFQKMTPRGAIAYVNQGSESSVADYQLHMGV